MKYLCHRVWLSPARFEWLSSAARRVPVTHDAHGNPLQPWFEYKDTMYVREQH